MSGNKEAALWMRPVRRNPVFHRSLLIVDDIERSIKTVTSKDSGYAKMLVSDRYLNFLKDNSFHRAIGPVLTIGQFFGVMPICGQLSPNPSKLRFSWKTWRFFHGLLCLGSLSVVTIFSIANIMVTKSDLVKGTEIIFNMSTVLSSFLFLKLAPRWPSLMAAISAKEINTNLYTAPTNKKSSSLKFKFSLTCFLVLFLALLEHILSVSSGIVSVYGCPTNETIAEFYFTKCFTSVFVFTPYALWKGIIFQFINLISAFNWNFADLFIIIVSVGLVERFERFNNLLESLSGKNLSEKYWGIIREEYAHLSRLVREVDDKLNGITLVAFSNNLFFICVQLFNLFKSKDSNPEEICAANRLGWLAIILKTSYFVYSFVFLLTRSLYVSLSASRLHTSSTKSSNVLFSVPASSYCIEVKRLLEQITTDIVALTGMNFFYITRGLVLTIAGTIVTYELVLFQFNAPPASVTANITVNDTCGGGGISSSVTKN